jgi:hypothetical protein
VTILNDGSLLNAFDYYNPAIVAGLPNSSLIGCRRKFVKKSDRMNLLSNVRTLNNMRDVFYGEVCSLFGCMSMDYSVSDSNLICWKENL